MSKRNNRARTKPARSKMAASSDPQPDDILFAAPSQAAATTSAKLESTSPLTCSPSNRI